MELWIWITIGAAFFQNIRSSLQKHLKSQMGTAGATFVRFGFGVPFAILFLTGFMAIGGHELPSINTSFMFWVVIAAFAQIIAQAMLVHMFTLRNFVVGSVYARTEPVQAAIFGLVFLGENAGMLAFIAIGICVVGIILLSVARTDMSAKSFVQAMTSKTALIGLGSGAFFGISAVGYRGASLALGGPHFLIQAAFTLTVAIILQSVVLMIFMYLKDPDEFGRIKKAWKIAAIVGFVGATASFGWFSAMTLQQAALVKAVAKIEILFSFVSSVFFFKEHINRFEVIGCLLIACGIIVLILG